MAYGFTYIDLATGNVNMETSTHWDMWWDYERKGEIRILHVEQTIDDWESSFPVFDASDM